MEMEPSPPPGFIGRLRHKLKSWRGRRENLPRVYVCRVCGTRAVPVMVREASPVLALVLFLLLIIPGLLYLLWQHWHPIAVCPLCGSNRIEPSRGPTKVDSIT